MNNLFNGHTIVIIIVVLFVLFVSYYLYTNYPHILNYNSTYTNNNVDTTDTMSFNISFTSDWGKNENINAPPNPHTGNMFFITHNNLMAPLFKEHEYSSKGISNTSMFGTINDLMSEYKNIANVNHIYNSGVLMLPNTSTPIKITTNEKFPYLSFATMTAPSPDWFTGINYLDLRNIKSQINIPLYMYDAGTDTGTIFTTEHTTRQPPVTITMKRDNYIYMNGNIQPIGHLIINPIN